MEKGRAADLLLFVGIDDFDVEPFAAISSCVPTALLSPMAEAWSSEM